MTVSAHLRRCRRGVSAAEFALVMPLLLALLLGIWELGRFLEVHQILTNAAREGGRQASLGKTDTEIQQAVTQYLQNAGLPTQNVVIPALQKVTQPSGIVAVKVQVTIPFKDVRWVFLPLITSSTTTLTAQASWFTP